MESITIDVGENERCPVGLDVLLHHSQFIVNLSPKGGVGDFEILNEKQEVVIVSQKHLSTVSLLEHTSRSELLTLDLNNLSDVRISCPPSEEIASISNSRMGLLQSNTLDIMTTSGHQPSKQFNFKFQHRPSNSDKSQGDQDQTQQQSSLPNFQVVNEGGVVVAEILLRSLCSRATVRFPGHVPLSPVQAAVIIAGLAFQIYAMKKHKKQLTLLLFGAVLGVTLLLLLIYLLTSS